jgi:phospholipase C
MKELLAVNRSRRALAFCVFPLLAACGTPVHSGDGGDGSIDADASTTLDVVERSRVLLPDGGVMDSSADAPDWRNSRIRHVVIVAEENHSFDTYFGRYCTAPTGSNPTCNDGPACCEAAPDHEASGASPVTLTDQGNGDYDPDHSFDCELSEIHGGAMDRFVAGASCSDARNFAIADNALMATYHGYAQMGALGDRYFQPLIGSTSANDMYFAVTHFVFRDNELKPDAVGQGCLDPRSSTAQFTGQTTIGDVLIDAGWTFGYYHEGYARMRASSSCPTPPSDCRSSLWPLSPCNYDCSDNPFQYYRQFTDNLAYMHDVDEFMTDLSAGRLPNLTFVKFATYHNEHPGFGTYISDGVRHVDRVIQAVLASPYAEDTLVLFTMDEGGGFFDHVAPPPTSTVDNEPYGTRIPVIALGRFARRNYVSHVVMEHSSIVRFVEWNFTGQTGQLHGRDQVVNSISSLLDSSEVGVAVP